MIASKRIVRAAYGLALLTLASSSQNPVVDSASPTSAANPGTVTILGANFEPTSTVSIDAVPATVLAQTPTSLDVSITPGTPGFSDVTVANSVGSTTVFDLLELWPSLTVLNAVIGGNVDLVIGNGTSGLYALAFSLQTLPAPVPVSGVYYGILLDPSVAFGLIGQDVITSAGTASVSVPIPNNPGLSGLSVYFQVFAQQGILFGVTQSFTNVGAAQLKLPLVPPKDLAYSENPAYYEVGQPITPNIPTVTGIVEQWSVAPALPPGLALDAVTGVVSGTPSTVTPLTDYLVTASNSVGSTSETLSIATNAFFLLSVSVSDGAVWEINRPIEFAFNLPVDLGSVSSTTVSIKSAAGATAFGTLSHLDVDLDGDGFFDGTDPKTLVFQPNCPLLEDLSDAGLQPGGVQYHVDVPGLDDGSGPTLLSWSGDPLAFGDALTFATPASLDPAVVFHDPIAGPPAPVVRPVGSSVQEASYVELGDDPLDRVYLEYDDSSGSYSVDPASASLPLNLYSDEASRVRVYLYLNQPLSPSDSNLSSDHMRVEFEESAGVWVPMQTRVELVGQCGQQHALVRLEPVGVLPQGWSMRVSLLPGLSDLIGETVMAPVDDFGIVPVDAPTFSGLSPIDDQADEFHEVFLVGGDTDESFEDTQFLTDALLADWGGGKLSASTGFSGTGGPGGVFDWHTPVGTFNFSTDLQQIVGGPDGIPTTQVQVVDGVLDVNDLLISAGSYVRLMSGENPLTILATGDVIIEGTLDVSGYDAKPVGTLYTPNQPEFGAVGAAGGGQGGTGSYLTTASTPAGGWGDGPFGTPGTGGRGGETGYSASADKQKRRGAGGGGGRFGPDQSTVPGEAATQGESGHPEGKGALSGGLLPAAGGLSGDGPFVDADSTNDFWGRMGVYDASGSLIGQIQGELPAPWAGYGGGAGGDAINADVFPTIPFGPPYKDKKGCGGGGGGGQVRIVALGRIIFRDGGRILCNGGDGNTGENVLGYDHIGGSSGGGSGGHVILESATQIDFTNGGTNQVAQEFVQTRGGVGGIGYTTSTPWSKGGEGGPGLVQLHVPNANPATAVGTTAADPIRIPVASSLADLTVPTGKILMLNLGSISKARSVWIPLSGAPVDPAGGFDPISFSFVGTVPDDASPDAGKILVTGDDVDSHGSLIAPTALGTSAPAPYVEPDGYTLVYSQPSLQPLISDTSIPSEDTYLRNPVLLTSFELVLQSGVDEVAYDVAAAAYDQLLVRLWVTVDAAGASLQSFVDSHGGPANVTATLVKRFFRVQSDGQPDKLPSSQYIRILFEGAEANADGTPGAVLQPWTADPSKLGTHPPGQLRFFRFEVEFNLGLGAVSSPTGSLSLDFLRAPFQF